MKYTDAQLIKRVESHAKGFDGWRKGVYDIWVRSAADVMDAFDDKVYTFNVPAKGAAPEFRMVCTGTSHAGSYGLKKFQNYNPDGCAVLESDRIVYDSHVYGLHRGYRAYRQAKAFPYYRDADRDDKAEEIGPVRGDIIYANCHRAAAKGESTRIYNWSVACLVRNRANQWAAWLAYMAKRPLTVCILKEF
jgi:hypothetical protein